MIQVCKLQRMYADMHTIIIQIELLSRMRGVLIAFQKREGGTYIHTTAYSWPTVRDPMPRANALGDYTFKNQTMVMIFIL